MFKTAYRLPFDLFGIPIKLDVTFLFLMVFLTWVIGTQVGVYVRIFNLSVDPSDLQRGYTPWLLGFLSALGLVISVLLHELGHSLTARRYGVQVKEITLWILGGVAQFQEMPRQRGAEAVVAIAGPLTSVAIALLFWLLSRIVSPEAGAVLFVMNYLAVVNMFLAIFNMLPALPLDGGRVLRSLLALRLSYLRATQVSAGISQVIAILMGIYGLLAPNLFLIAIAFFIYTAVRGETQYALITQALEDIRVRDIMTRDVISVEPHMKVANFVQLMFFKKHLGYPVVDADGRLVGIVKLHHAENASEDALVSEIMSREPNTIEDHRSAVEAFQRISQNDIGRLVVVDRTGRMVGILSKTDLVRAIQIRMVSHDIDIPLSRTGPQERP
jgi:Zn-dependent protease/CBS domain-containing protein